MNQSGRVKSFAPPPPQKKGRAVVRAFSPLVPQGAPLACFSNIPQNAYSATIPVMGESWRSFVVFFCCRLDARDLPRSLLVTACNPAQLERTSARQSWAERPAAGASLRHVDGPTLLRGDLGDIVAVEYLWSRRHDRPTVWGPTLNHAL